MYNDMIITGSNDKMVKLFQYKDGKIEQLRIWILEDYVMTVRIRRHGTG